MARAEITATIDGKDAVELTVGYEVVGDRGPAWVIMPGGRFGRDSPGMPELAVDLAALGNRVLVWDRPNCGDSDVCFVGSSESAMQADVLAALIEHLGLGPTILAGGSGGARVALLAAARHPRVAAGLTVWWITGGVYGLMRVGTNYGGFSVEAAWANGMDAVAELPEWREVVEKNPENRRHFAAQDPRTFIETIERWMLVHVPREGELIPGLPDVDAQRIRVPTLVLRNGMSDPVHTRVTTERLADLIPGAELADPPWPDREAVDSKVGRRFVGWPALAPALDSWARRTFS